MQNIPLSELPEGDRITPMAGADIPVVHQLECISQQNPWSQQHFLDELNNPVASVDLYWHGEELAGFLCTWLIAGEMQIQNVATSPTIRRQGIAARLLQHAIERNREELSSIFLEVRAGNTPAITLYEKLGFVESGTRQNYYPDGEDALLMSYHLE
jgi:ribosomal-protein-alanine N-acetyltransferase